MKKIILITALLFSCFSQNYCPVHNNHYHRHIHKSEDVTKVIPQLSFDNKVNNYKQDNSYYLYVSSKSLENISTLSFDVLYEKDVINVNNVSNYLSIDSSSMYDSKIDNENGVIHVSYIFSENTKFEDTNFIYFDFNILNTEKKNSYFSIAITSATDQDTNSIEMKGDFYYFSISKSVQSNENVYIYGQVDKENAKRNDLVSISYVSYDFDHIGAGSFEFIYDKDAFEFFSFEKGDFLNSSSMYSTIKTDIPGCVRVSFADSNTENTYSYNLFTIQLKVKVNIDKNWEFKLNSSGLSSKDGNKKYLSDTIINNITTVYEEDVSLLPLLYLTSKTDESNNKLDIILHLEENSHLAAADIDLNFDATYLSYNSYESLVKLSDNPMLGVNTNDVKTGLIKISWVYLSDLTLKVDFVKLSFDILDVFNEIKTPVTLKASGTRDLNLKEIKLACQGIEIPLSINKHDWSNWEVVNEPTCIKEGLEKRVCSYCNKIETRTISSNPSLHVCGDWEIVKEPTCTETGIKVQKCTECGEIINQEELPLKKHYVRWVVTKEPTCSDYGIRSLICYECNQVFKTQQIDKLEHSLGEWEIIKEPTCTERGLKAQKCTVCGETINYEEIPLKEHNGERIISREPTCTETGLKEERCIECGTIINAEIIEATGHSYGDWIIDTNATCTDKGLMHKICLICGYKVTETIAPHGHNLIHHDKVNPTCTTSGHEAYDTCSKCDYSTYKEIPALGHDYVTKVVGPTCTKDGYKEEVCTCCGDTRNRTVIPATGHAYGDWITDKDSTCTESGSKHKTCGTCGDVITETIVPHGHDLVHHDKVDPTCTTSGHEAYDTCSKCDYSTYKKIPALGHDYGEWKVEVEPTTDSEGLKTRTCSICGEKETEIIPKLEKEINLNPIIIGGTCALGGLIVIVLIIVMFKNRRR